MSAMGQLNSGSKIVQIGVTGDERLTIEGAEGLAIAGVQNV